MKKKYRYCEKKKYSKKVEKNYYNNLKVSDSITQWTSRLNQKKKEISFYLTQINASNVTEQKIVVANKSIIVFKNLYRQNSN